MKWSKWLIVTVAAALMIPASPGSAAPPTDKPTTAPVDSASEAFPDGLPAGARLNADGDVIFADGAILKFNATYQDCPDLWMCLYEHWYYNRDRAGRLLQFADCCYWQDLGWYSFNNMMSSWRMRLSHKDGRWAYNSQGGGTTRCMDYYSQNPWVGVGDNDKASSIYIYSWSDYCGAP